MEFFIEWSWWHFQSLAPFQGKRQIILTYMKFWNNADTKTKKQVKAAAEPHKIELLK
jgi:hypothetical protein